MVCSASVIQLYSLLTPVTLCIRAFGQTLAAMSSRLGWRRNSNLVVVCQDGAERPQTLSSFMLNNEELWAGQLVKKSYAYLKMASFSPLYLISCPFRIETQDKRLLRSILNPIPRLNDK